MRDSVTVDKRPLISMIRLCALLNEYWGIAGIVSGKSKYKDGVAVAKAAGVINAKDGTFSIPIQAFSRSYVSKIGGLIGRVFEQNMDPVEALAEVLSGIAEEIRKSIKERGHVVTGLMLDTVGWVIRKGSRGGKTIKKGK